MAKSIIKGIPNVALALLVLAAVGWQQGWFGGLAVTGGQQQPGQPALGCFASGASTTNLLFDSQESLATTDGTINHNGGTVVSYLAGSTQPFETTALLNTGTSSTTDPSCGVAVRSIFQNTSVHLVEVDFSASRDANTPVVFKGDLIPTITVRAKNSTAMGVSNTIHIVAAVGATDTSVALNLQAATARGVIYNPVACVQYNSTAFSSVSFIGKTEIGGVTRLAAPSTTNVNGTVAKHCFDLGLGNSVQNWGYSPDLPMQIVASSAFSPGNINVTIMERAPYLLNGVLLTGAEDGTFTKPTYSATDAYMTVAVTQ